jgi:predicted protein tyrosine phosphatase
MHTRMVHSRAAKRSRCTDVPVSWMYMHHIEIHDIVHYILHYILTVGIHRSRCTHRFRTSTMVHQRIFLLALAEHYQYHCGQKLQSQLFYPVFPFIV